MFPVTERSFKVVCQWGCTFFVCSLVKVIFRKCFENQVVFCVTVAPTVCSDCILISAILTVEIVIWFGALIETLHNVS